MDEQETVTAPGERFRDFDAFFAEQKAVPVQMKIFGQVETLPANLPAGVVLEMLRMQEAGITQTENGEVFKLAEMLFGRERLDRWVAAGLDVVQLGTLVQWVIGEYSRIGSASPFGSGAGGGEKNPKKGKR